MKISNKGFGAYDIRGIYPEEVNEELAYRIGRVFVDLFHAKKVAIGHDIRLSGPSIRDALAKERVQRHEVRAQGIAPDFERYGAQGH